MTMALPDSAALSSLLPRRSRAVMLADMLPWLLIAAAYVLLPTYLPLGTQIMVMILFAISLDLIVGYAGIVSLGHAAFFGLGAYAAGLVSIHLSPDPFAGLAAGAAVATLVGLGSGLLVLRTRGLTLLMLTLAVVFILHEIANRAAFLTGGDDGLQGIDLGPVAGQWSFDLYGGTAYLYTAAVLFAAWVFVRRLLASPFGLGLVGIRENATRMRAIGAPVFRRRLAAYAVSAGLAGLAGALSAQTTQFVALKSISFDLSGEILIMLILGGVGRIYGAFIGPAFYMVAQDMLAKGDPAFWSLWVGLILIAFVLFGRNGMVGVVESGWSWLAVRWRGHDDRL